MQAPQTQSHVLCFGCKIKMHKKFLTRVETPSRYVYYCNTCLVKRTVHLERGNYAFKNKDENLCKCIKCGEKAVRKYMISLYPDARENKYVLVCIDCFKKHKYSIKELKKYKSDLILSRG